MNRPEQAPNRNLSPITYTNLVGTLRNASDPIVSKTLDSAIPRPVSPNSPILPTRQKTSPEKTTGYGHGRLRRESGKDDADQRLTLRLYRILPGPGSECSHLSRKVRG